MGREAHTILELRACCEVAYTNSTLRLRTCVLPSSGRTTRSVLRTYPPGQRLGRWRLRGQRTESPQPDRVRAPSEPPVEKTLSSGRHMILFCPNQQADRIPTA